jgi:hypothetical protein
MFNRKIEMYVITLQLFLFKSNEKMMRAHKSDFIRVLPFKTRHSINILAITSKYMLYAFIPCYKTVSTTPVHT